MLTNLQFANIMASNNQNNKDYASCLVLLAATEWASGAVRSDCTCSFPSTMAYVFTVKSLWKSFSSSPKPKPKETVPVHSKATYYPVIAEWPATHVLMRSPRHTMMQVLYTRTLHGYPEKFKTPWVLEKLSVMTQILCSLWRRLVWQLHYFLLLTAAATMLTRSTTFLWNYSTIGNFHGPTPFFFHFYWSLHANSAFSPIFDFRSVMLRECNQHGERKDNAQATSYMPLWENYTSLPVHRFCLAVSTTKKQPCSCCKKSSFEWQQFWPTKAQHEINGHRKHTNQWRRSCPFR